MDATTQNKRTSTDVRRPVRPSLSSYIPQSETQLTKLTVRRDVQQDFHNEARPRQ
jgi:hypothetical protein